MVRAAQASPDSGVNSYNCFDSRTCAAVVKYRDIIPKCDVSTAPYVAVGSRGDSGHSSRGGGVIGVETGCVWESALAERASGRGESVCHGASFSARRPLTLADCKVPKVTSGFGLGRG